MLRLTFVCIVLAVGLIAAVRNRFGALQLYVWFALFRPQEWVWFDISKFRASLVLGALLVIPSVCTGIWPVIGHPLSLGMLGFLGTSFVAQTGAVDSVIGWYWLDFMSKLVLVCLLAIRLTNTVSRLVLLVGTIAWSFGFHPAKAGIGVLLGGADRLYGGIGGAFADNNTYAVGCVVTIPLLIAFAQSVNSRFARWATYGVIAPVVITIISTFSRGGLLSLVAVLFTFVLLQRRRTLLVACFTLLLPLLFLVGLPEGYSDRMSTIRSYEDVGETSALGRLHFWEVALDIARERPWGIGLWNFEATYDAYDFSAGQYGTRRAVHNSHLQVLTETGWLGALCWVVLFATAFRQCVRAKRRAAHLDPSVARPLIAVANGITASMLGFLVGGTFVSMALNEITWLTFVLVASLDRICADLPKSTEQQHAVSAHIGTAHSTVPAMATR